METAPFKELRKCSKHFGKFILTIIVIVLIIIIFLYVSENIFNKIHSKEITLETAIISAMVLGIFTYFYFTEQVREPKNRRIKAKFGAVSFCLVVFLTGTYGGSLLSKVGFTDYGIFDPEEKYQFFVDMLLVLLTFTALVWYLLHRKIESEMKSSVEITKDQNRHFTEAHAFKNSGYLHYHIYREHYKKYLNKRERNKNVVEKDVIAEAREQLRNAIDYTEKALSVLKDLDEIENETLICIIKNNLAYYLAIKWQCIKETKNINNDTDNHKELKEYLSNKEKKDKYEKDKQVALKYIKYIGEEERIQKYPSSIIVGITETCKDVKKIFEDIDNIIE